MRRHRLVTAGIAALAPLGLLVAGPVPAAANLAGTEVVISELQSRAANVDNDIANAVELYNPTSTDRDISGWEITFFDASNTPTAGFSFPSGTEVPAFGHILVTDPNYIPTPATQAVLVSGVTLFAYNLEPTATDGLEDLGGVALFDSSAVRVDGVATDSNATDALEGNAAEALEPATDPANASIQRDVLALDTDNNEDDFMRRPADFGTLN